MKTIVRSPTNPVPPDELLDDVLISLPPHTHHPHAPQDQTGTEVDEGGEGKKFEVHGFTLLDFCL